MTANTNRILYCPHSYRSSDSCAACSRLIAEGKVARRPLYRKQRLYEMRKFLDGDCIKCGGERRTSPYRKFCKRCGKKESARKRRWEVAKKVAAAS